MLKLQRELHNAVTGAVRRELGLDDPPAFLGAVPPNRTMGDLAITVAFQLARLLKKPPRTIAQQLSPALEAVAGVARVEAAPNGYLNVFLDRRQFFLARLAGDDSTLPGPTEKTIV